MLETKDSLNLDMHLRNIKLTGNPNIDHWINLQLRALMIGSPHGYISTISREIYIEDITRMYTNRVNKKGERVKAPLRKSS